MSHVRVFVVLCRYRYDSHMPCPDNIVSATMLDDHEILTDDTDDCTVPSICFCAC